MLRLAHHFRRTATFPKGPINHWTDWLLMAAIGFLVGFAAGPYVPWRMF